MGKIKDFIAKWQDIDRPEWDKDVIEDKRNVQYTMDISDEQQEIIKEKHELDTEQIGKTLSVHYKEGEKEYTVYLHFTDTNEENHFVYEEFDSRKEAKDKVEYLMDKYTELVGN